MIRVIGAGVVLALSACGGGGDADICSPIGSSGALRSQSAGVQVDRPSAAYDGDLSTAAEMYAISGSGSAQFGASGGAGSASFAGVLLGLPRGQVTQVSVQLLRNGSVVSSGTAGTQSDSSQVCPGICQEQGGKTFFGISAGQVFDEIRATLQISGTTEDTLVYELCLK